jgi:hypothetical protein
VEVLRQIADEFLEADADEIDSETRGTPSSGFLTTKPVVECFVFYQTLSLALGCEQFSWQPARVKTK